MRTMFVKLFFCFCLASVLSGCIFFLLAVNVRLQPMHAERGNRFEEEHRHLVGSVLSLYGESAALLLERGLPLTKAESKSDGRMQAYLFSTDGTPLSSDAPEPLRTAVRERIALPGTTPLNPPLSGGMHAPPVVQKQHGLVVVRVTGPSGRSYLAGTMEPTFMPPPPRPGFGLPPGAWLNFAVTILISGLVCYVLAWRLTKPIRRLRAATRSLAAGDLAARVELAGERGGDELSDLGREFNSMAERLEKLVNSHRRLLRDVSHELRSPLARLGVALEIARKVTASYNEPSEPSANTALNRIEQEAERVNRMIDELLELSRLEGGIASIVFDRFDLAGFIEELVRDADFEAVSLGRRVAYLPAAAVFVRGNRELLRRALENVLRNAIRYTREDSAVEVSLEEAAGKVTILVRDHGQGVPEVQLGDIFRPFYRVAEARDRKSGGTGIGLAICEETVTLHGGSIQAYNAAGGGLAVRITLPAGSNVPDGTHPP